MKRVKRVHEILTLLHKLAHRFGCVVSGCNCIDYLPSFERIKRFFPALKVIVTNDVTTRISDVDGGERPDVPQIVPALGGSLTHKVNQRIFLGRDESHFDAQSQAPPSYVASIEKGHFLPSVTVAFRIEPAGIRGVKREG